MKLTYSNYKMYLECPKRYYYTTNYIKPPREPSKYFAIYGMLIESFFKLYTNFYLKNNISIDNKKIKEILEKNWNTVLLNNHVDWKDPWVKEKPEDIFNNAYNDIIENIEKIHIWKNTISETTLNILLKKSGDLLSGRIDFIVTDNDKIEILDGKGTYKLEKTVDIEQLYFYILLYTLHNQRMPDKAGFLYYKYKIISYIEFDKKALVDFKNKLLLTMDMIKKDKDFKPIVNVYGHCKWCPYNEICQEYINKKVELSIKKQELPIEENLFIDIISPSKTEDFNDK